MDVQIDEQQHAYHRERQGTRKLWVPEDSDSGYKIVVCFDLYWFITFIRVCFHLSIFVVFGT